jgi:phosphoribosylamine--glycine ligase
MVNALQEEGLLAYGPTKEAAKIEWSKVFAKNLAYNRGIPTADFRVVSDMNFALHYADHHQQTLYAKLDGLFAGKGAIKCETIEDVERALAKFAHMGRFGNGHRALLEEGLEGPEISLQAWCDGLNYRMVPFAMQYHKTRDANDQGPMTGGMGVFGPVPGISPDDINKLGRRFVEPALRALYQNGTPFQGMLFPGLVLTAEGPKLLEWNAREGNPETQVWVPLLGDDLLKIMMAVVEGRLGRLGRYPEIKWRQASAACIVLATKGYPDHQKPGAISVIEGLENIAEGENLRIFQAGTKNAGHKLVATGGRTLSVVAVGSEGEEPKHVIERGYAEADKIRFNGAKPVMRRDIGQKALSLAFRERVEATRHLF